MYSVLPPPRVVGNGGIPLETNNILERPNPEETEHHLVLGEGTYQAKDYLLLATPPLHPSDVVPPNTNPLAINRGPPTAGVQLSIAIIKPLEPPSHNLFRTVTGHSTRSNVPPSIQEEFQSPKNDAGSTSNGFGTANYYGHSPSFGNGNPALTAPPTKNKKDQKSKPKNNIVKSNSSFVSRVIPHEALQKRLNERSPEGLLAFANINRAYVWLDLASEGASKTENLTKVLFTKAHPLCHDLNPVTRSSAHLDLILGFNSSDIIWYEPMSQKYTRLNKNGAVNPSAVTCVLWLPGKENLFLAAHLDGTLVVYDKDKEDAEFVPEEASPFDSSNGLVNGATRNRFQVRKSVQSKNQKANPVAVWKTSNMKINGIAFSPDGQLLAVVSENGTLAILDYINERLLDVYRSYFGGLACVTWSPDGRYVLTGGQDDLVSIWSLADSALVARCEGHQSWVTDVKFDPWRCDERNYRFGSVGEDGRLLLWDFSAGMLGRPKAQSIRPRGSIGSHLPPDRRESVAQTLTQQVDGHAEGESAVHPVEAKASTANLPPVMSKIVDGHPLSWLGFVEHGIVTSCKDGHIREWSRPDTEEA